MKNGAGRWRIGATLWWATSTSRASLRRPPRSLPFPAASVRSPWPWSSPTPSKPPACGRASPSRHEPPRPSHRPHRWSRQRQVDRGRPAARGGFRGDRRRSRGGGALPAGRQRRRRGAHPLRPGDAGLTWSRGPLQSRRPRLHRPRGAASPGVRHPSPGAEAVRGAGGPDEGCHRPRGAPPRRGRLRAGDGFHRRGRGALRDALRARGGQGDGPRVRPWPAARPGGRRRAAGGGASPDRQLGRLGAPPPADRRADRGAAPAGGRAVSRFVLVTGNPGKLAEARTALGKDLEAVEADLPEIQSLDYEEVLREKAAEAWRRIGRPLIVEEAGLDLAALNGFPGPLVKWMLGAVGPRGSGRPRAAPGYPGASARCFLLYKDGDCEVMAEGRTEGTLVVPGRGTHGFGWDPVFLPEGSPLTFAELTGAEKDAVSHRGKAWRGMGGRVGGGETRKGMI